MRGTTTKSQTFLTGRRTVRNFPTIELFTEALTELVQTRLLHWPDTINEEFTRCDCPAKCVDYVLNTYHLVVKYKDENYSLECKIIASGKVHKTSLISEVGWL